MKDPCDFSRDMNFRIRQVCFLSKMTKVTEVVSTAEFFKEGSFWWRDPLDFSHYYFPSFF